MVLSTNREPKGKEASVKRASGVIEEVKEYRQQRVLTAEGIDTRQPYREWVLTKEFQNEEVRKAVNFTKIGLARGNTR